MSYRKHTKQSGNGSRVAHHTIKLFTDERAALETRISLVKNSLTDDKTEWEATLERMVEESPSLQAIKARSESASVSLNQLNDRLDEVSRYPKVSEHAMLRYIERVLGVNVQRIAERLLPPQAVAHIKASKSGGKLVVDGLDGAYTVVWCEQGVISSTWLATETELETLPVFRPTAAEMWGQLLEDAS